MIITKILFWLFIAGMVFIFFGKDHAAQSDFKNKIDEWVATISLTCMAGAWTLFLLN